MKVSSLALFLFLVFSSSSFSGDGDHVGNGGGLAEQNFHYANERMVDWIYSCTLVFNDCLLTTKERAVLEQIRRLSMETRERANLQFLSGRLNPGLFETDDHGKTRVAVTGSEPGSIIFINLDLIYSDDSEMRPLVDALGAFAILIHEVGHHTGEKDHLFLDQLANKVRGFREKSLEAIDLSNYHRKEFRVLAHNLFPTMDEQRGSLRTDGKFTALTLENGLDVIALDQDFAKMFACPQGSNFVSSHYTNLSWARLEKVSNGLQPITFHFDLDLECRTRKGWVNILAYRMQFLGKFQVVSRLPSGELVPSNYPEEWKLRKEENTRFLLHSYEWKMEKDGS